jgi:cellulose synthase/poly-beta-1,6-N-acetylglucosamine synthase-like glycosyltransferase
LKKFTSEEIKEFVPKLFFDEKVILNRDPSLPKISIVTPSYNQTKFLERSVLSCVLNQNYPNLEYIIIGGASIHGTLDIIKKCEDRINSLISTS